MIELVSATRCSSCNICVRVCPCDVFDLVPGAPPVIARQVDCQTCFMCEAYCPDDALFVAADVNASVQVREVEIERNGLFGSYRRGLGWHAGSETTASLDETHRLQDIRDATRTR